MAKSKSRNLADVIGKKSIYAQNYTDVAANNGVTLSQLAIDVDAVEGLIGSGTSSLVSNTYLQSAIANTNAWIATENARIDLLNTNLTSTNTAIRSYVDQEVANLVDSAPATLDTLNELAAALGDNPNFATTLTTNLSQKLGASATVTLNGDVTGTASFSSNAVTVTTDIANSGVTAGSYGSSSAIPVITVGADGRVTSATTQAVAGVNSFSYSAANNTLTIATADGGNFTATIDQAEWDNYMTVANTNAAIASAINNLVDGAPAALDTLNELAAAINDDANYAATVTTALGTKATWSALTATNTAIRSLVSDVDGRADLLNTNLTSTNTAIRTLVNSNLANTNAWIATENARIDLVNTNLTSTNTALRSLISTNASDISNVRSELYATNTAIRALVTDNANETSALWSALTSTNTAVRAYTDTAVSNLVDSAPATLDTLNELAAALGDDPNFATTLTTNLGQKLGATATVTLTGDVSGSGSFSSNSVSIAVTVADDSHNHVLSNVDGLESALANRMQVANTIALVNSRLGATASVALTGDVTGTATFSANAVSVTTDIANSGVTSGTYGSSTEVPVVVIGADGRVTSATTQTVAGVTGFTFTQANNNLRITVADGTTYDAVVNVSDKATWTELLATNTAIRSLISTNAATELSHLANTNAYIADESARIDLLNTNLTSTNTAIRSYVDTSVANLVDSAPAALDTLNELASALGDDENFATTLATNLGQKLGATATVTLSGDVTGSANFSANSVTVVTDIANTAVTAGSYGSASAIPVITVAADGRITGATTQTVAGVTATTYTQGNNVYRVSTADGKTFDTVIPTSDKLQVANAAATYETISNVNAYLANTNAYIASVSATERAALANTNAYIANVKTIATNRLGETATITLTGDVGGTASFSSNAATITVLSNNLAANSFVTANYVANTTFQTFVANNQYVFSEYTYTASNNQQSFGGADDNGNTLSYVSGKTSVFMNGVLLVNGSDYYASNTTSIWLADGAGTGDVISMQAFSSAANFVEKDANISTGSTTLSGTSAQVVDSFGTGDYRTAKYIVQCTDTDNNYYQSAEVLLIHDGTNVEITQYGSVELGAALPGDIMTIDADISGGNVRLKVTPTGTNSVVKVLRLMIV